MATTYSITKAGVVNHDNTKELLYAHTILIREIMRKTEQYEIVREQDNEFFVDVLSTDLMQLSEELVRIACAVRDKIDRLVA